MKNYRDWIGGDTSKREIIHSKIFEEPVDFVFEMYSKPQHTDNWWGPTGFITKTSTMDFMTGGNWEYQMIGPDGKIYDNLINYLEILTNEKIVYSHRSTEEDEEEFITIIDFEPVGEGTKLTVHMIFQTIDQYRNVVDEYGAIEGLIQTIGRLYDYIKNMKI